VATTVDADGAPAGITISSFNSVSLDPPLVLWSIARESYSYDTFVNAEYFAVNVLKREQHALSAHFAQRSAEKFDGLELRVGLHGVPLLSDYAACFECRTEYRYEGGDHKILVGRVLRLDERQADPLVIYRGQFLGRNGSPQGGE
jgi:3-hydroxy-9,10-secoandrosta-1,3,5(10)-triene-9,17-dione monooxygenase reductase component